jgi:thiol:disulfide interchange protein DsbC
MRKLLLAAAALMVAATAPIALASEATVKAALLKKYPQIQIQSVAKTPLAGMYEIYADGQLHYTDEKATYLFVNASMIDTDKKINLTEERMNKLNAVNFDQLPLDLAFRKVKGKGTRKMAYFGDPNCGYCKKFEQDLARIEDVTVYIFLYPVLGPDSLQKTRAVWCSKDRVKTWDDQLLNNIAPTGPGTCDTPIDKILAFGRSKNITGTPTLFFVDGTRVPGAIPYEQIEQKLASAKPVR